MMVFMVLFWPKDDGEGRPIGSKILLLIGLGLAVWFSVYMIRKTDRAEQARKWDAVMRESNLRDEGFYAGMRATMASIKIDGTNFSVDITDVLRHKSYTNK